MIFISQYNFIFLIIVFLRAPVADHILCERVTLVKDQKYMYLVLSETPMSTAYIWS